MKKQLRFVLTVLFALVGMTSWAETHVWDPAAITDGTVISLQCRDTNGGSNYFFNGGATKSATFGYDNLFRVVAASTTTFNLQRVSDGKFVSSASPVTMVDAGDSNVAEFRVARENPTGWTTKTEGTDENLTLRFYLNGTNNKLNAQGSGSVPTYAGGTGGYSIWYVYTYTSEEVANLAISGPYNQLLAQAQEAIDFVKSTESGNKWVAIVNDPANIYSPKTETPGNEPGTGVHCLIDNNPSTYWHSKWTNPVGDPDDHYLQFDLGEAYSNLQMQYQKRQNQGANVPQTFSVTGSNDGETFESVKTIEIENPGDDAIRHSWEIENSTAYRYIRVRATTNGQGTENKGFWHASEMNFYKYEYVDGVNLYTKAGSIATNVEAVLANPATAPTQADLDALQALYDKLYEFIHAIDAYRNIPYTLNMYNGYRATEEQVAALQEAITNYDAAAAQAVVDAITAVDNTHTAFRLTTERGKLFVALHTPDAPEADEEGEAAGEQYIAVAENNKFGLTLEEGKDLDLWAFVDYEGGKYLYNVGAKLFLNNDRIMNTTPTADAITVIESSNVTYPFMLKSGDLFFNVSSGFNEGFAIDTWSQKDGGNQFQIVAVEDFDPTYALHLLNTTGIDGVNAEFCPVVYNLNGQRVAKAQKGLYIVNRKKVVLK